MAIDRAVLRAAIFRVSERHNWATETDTEDRTDEIAKEYELDTPVSRIETCGWADHDFQMANPGLLFCRKCAQKRGI